MCFFQTLPRLLDAPSIESVNATIVSCGARHSSIITGIYHVDFYCLQFASLLQVRPFCNSLLVTYCSYFIALYVPESGEFLNIISVIRRSIIPVRKCCKLDRTRCSAPLLSTRNFLRICLYVLTTSVAFISCSELVTLCETK